MCLRPGPSQDTHGGQTKTTEATPLLLLKKRGAPFVLRWYHVAQLAGITALGAASSDAYVPLLPQIQRELNASIMVCSLSLQLNWVANGVASSAWGAISDKIGRRRALIAALWTFLFGTAACALSKSVATLVAGRVLQGIGEGAAQLPVAVVRDVLADDDLKCNRLIASIMQLTPAVIVAAPAFGGWLGGWLGWRAVFGALFAWGVCNLVGVVLCLPETRRPREQQPTTKKLTPPRAASRVFPAPVWGYLVHIALLYGVVGTMLTALPYDLETRFDLSSKLTGLWMGSIGVAGFLGSTLNKWVSSYRTQGNVEATFPLDCLLRGAMRWYLVVSASVGVAGLSSRRAFRFFARHVLATMAPIYLLIGTQFFAIPAATALMLQALDDDDANDDDANVEAYSEEEDTRPLRVSSSDEETSSKSSSRRSTHTQHSRHGLVAGLSGTANLVAIATASFVVGVGVAGGSRAASEQTTGAPQGRDEQPLGQPRLLFRLLFLWSALALIAHAATRLLLLRRRHRRARVDAAAGTRASSSSSSSCSCSSSSWKRSSSASGCLAATLSPGDDVLSVASEEEEDEDDEDRLIDDEVLHRLILRGRSRGRAGRLDGDDAADSESSVSVCSLAQDVATI